MWLNLWRVRVSALPFQSTQRCRLSTLTVQLRSVPRGQTQCSNRLLATTPRNSNLSSLELMNAKVQQDTTVFTYDNANLFKWITVFGLVQFAFWTNLAYFCYSSLNGVKLSKPSELGGWWTTVIELQQRYRYRIACACLSLGTIVLYFTTVYPQRTICKLVLLKGGELVRLSTYSHFGRVKHFVVPLRDVSCRQSRASSGPQISMKLRGRWFYYMIDKRDGLFNDPMLFDYVVALNRFTK